MRSSMTGTVVALYPSPAGATESEIDLFAWNAMVGANPMLDRLEADAEALVVNRLSDPPRYAWNGRPELAQPPPARRPEQKEMNASWFPTTGR